MTPKQRAAPGRPSACALQREPEAARHRTADGGVPPGVQDQDLDRVGRRDRGDGHTPNP